MSKNFEIFFFTAQNKRSSIKQRASQDVLKILFLCKTITPFQVYCIEEVDKLTTLLLLNKEVSVVEESINLPLYKKKIFSMNKH